MTNVVPFFDLSRQHRELKPEIEAAVRQVLDSGRFILGPQVDRSRFPGFKSKDHKLASAMVVPVMLRDELFGVLSVSSRSRRIRYDEEDLGTLLVFAETAGIASRHAEQANWMRQTIQRLDADLSERRGTGRRAA